MKDANYDIKTPPLAIRVLRNMKGHWMVFIWIVILATEPFLLLYNL